MSDPGLVSQSDGRMDSDRQTGGTEMKEDLNRFGKTLDNLISVSKKHSITDAAETFKGWRNQVQELKTRLDSPPKTKIAVYGNTGEGKSSLLNAIFDEPDLLPTSGMGDACTSVVIKIETVLEDQRESKAFQADIIFLNDEEWNAEKDFLKNDLEGDRKDKVYRDTKTKLSALYGDGAPNEPDELRKAFEERTDINQKIGTTIKTNIFFTADGLREDIEDYIIVKESGQQYWPIVKCIVIRLLNPDVCHQGVVFVDLPGIGDSNPFRVKMAEEEKLSAGILLVVTKIARCKASPTVESIIGDEMYIQMKMDHQKNVLVCTRTDDVDVKGAKKLMKTEEQEAVIQLENQISKCKQDLKTVDSKDQEGRLLASEKNLTQQLLEKCATARNDYIKGNLCENTDTKVFCVSSTDYMKGAQLGYSGDRKPLVFENMEHTEIPHLQKHLEEEAAKSRKQEMVDIQRHFDSIISDTYSFISNFNVTGKDHMVEAVSNELNKMKRSLEQAAEDMEKEIDDLFDRKLFPVIREGAIEARDTADETCLSWGKSTLNVKALHHRTYKATVVRSGQYNFNDFNRDLAKPLLIKMTVPWEEVFGPKTWKGLMNEKVIMPAAEIIKDHAAEIQKLLLDGQGGKLHENLDMIKNDAVSKLQNLTTIFQHIVEPSQRSANRSIVSTLKEMLSLTYKRCAEETGKGSYERMRQIMEGYVKDHKDNLFKESRDTLMQKLKKIREEAGVFIKDHLSAINDEYLKQLNPLWMQTAVGKQYLEEFFDVRGSISFLSPEEATAAQNIFNSKRDVNIKAFRDQDLVFQRWEKQPEFLVPRDLPTSSIQALVSSDWFPQNANIHIHLVPKVTVNVKNSKNVQLGDHNRILQGTGSQVTREEPTVAPFPTSSSSGNSEDTAKVSIYSTYEDELKKIFDALDGMKKLMESPCLVMDIQKMGPTIVTIIVIRKINEPCSLYSIVKKIFHSIFLHPLIMSHAVTVTSDILPFGVTDGTRVGS